VRSADFVIGEKSNPYMLRWFVWLRNSKLNLYLHKFLRDDDDRTLHDHPWWFVSIILKGSYREIVPHSPRPKGLHQSVNWPKFAELVRTRFSVAFCSATHRHRVILDRDEFGRLIPCWTLVLTGPRIRDWGFWCPKGFVPYEQFTKPGDHGEVGKGCD
jgi:hypothetical protein